MKHKQTRVFCFIRHILWSKKIVCIAFLSLSFFQMCNAANLSKLYESNVKVEAGKSENELIAAAFTHVLVKVSGRSDVSSLASYSAMLEKAKDAISQFRYDYKEISLGDDTSSSQLTAQANGSQPANGSDNPDIKKEKWFWVRFNAKTIDRLLIEANLPVWGKIRPESLVWFSQEIKGKRNIQSQYDAPQIYDALQKQAEYRGISLMFPFLDLQDQANVSATDIWGNFNDAILLASRRYQAQATVTLRLFKEPSGLWVSQWNLLMLGAVQSWEIRDEKLARILASGIDELANKLAQQFTQSVDDGSDAGLLVQINNVVDFRAFQELDDYLRNLATVKSADLLSMEQDRVIYNIIHLGNKSSFIQEVRLGDMLNSVERSRVDHQGSGNESEDFKAVILGDLDKNRNRQSGKGSDISPRETALKSLDANKSSGKAGSKSMEAGQMKPEGTEQLLPEPVAVPETKAQELIPELEYWLISPPNGNERLSRNL